MKKSDDCWQLARFIIVGVLNTVVGYGTYLLFLYLELHYLVAMVTTYIIVVTHSYFWNKYWTFKSEKKNHSEKLKFVSVYAVTFILNGGLLIFFVENVHLTPQIAGFPALLIVTMASFFGHKFWSFKNKHERKIEKNR